MLTDEINILDYIRYVKYPTIKGIAILVNDVLGLHIREDNIEDYTLDTIDNKSRLTLKMNPSLKTSLDGYKYQGRVRLLYNKIEASLVYPNGFYTHKKNIDESNLRNILTILKKNTRVIILEEECKLVERDDSLFIDFNEDSVFWKGSIEVKSLEDLTYTTKDIDEVIFKDILDGFEFDTTRLEDFE